MLRQNAAIPMKEMLPHHVTVAQNAALTIGEMVPGATKVLQIGAKMPMKQEIPQESGRLVQFL